MKHFEIVGFFPHIIAHRAYQSCDVDAANICAAPRRAMEVFKTRDGIKGRRIREVHLKIRLVENGAKRGGRRESETENES